MDLKMVKEDAFGLMDPSMKAIGTWERLMDMELISIWMVELILVIGKMD